MNEIVWKIVKYSDRAEINLIADWYEQEWNIPREKTIQNLNFITENRQQFQILVTVNDFPVATGGVHNYVGLLSRETRFKAYRNWMALVYTIPEKRNLGLGSFLCKKIQEYGQLINLNEIYLSTHSAEKLYTRLGWQVAERLMLDNKEIVIMKIRF